MISRSRSLMTIFAALLVATSAVYAQTWTGQTSGVAYDLNAVYFSDANHGTAVGWFGTILRTANGGAAWSTQSIGVYDDLYAVFFTDLNTGTAVGAYGAILRTVNGGTLWTSQTNTDMNALYGVSFTDANTGTAVGRSGVILRTTNGGTLWSAQTSGVSELLRAVSFTDANNGTAVGLNGTIVRTTDGGSHWVKPSSGTSNHLYGVSFTGTSNGTAVGDLGTILRTTDGGATWTPQTSGSVNNLRAVSFTDANNGTVVGLNGIVLRTANGGTSWGTQSSGTSGYLYGVSFVDANAGTAVGAVGTIINTINGALPVQITSFTAALTNGSSVALHWTTASEVNNFGFYLQTMRSGDRDFLDITGAFIAGHRTTTASHSYSYTVTGSFDLKSSFRLEQVDLDGTVHFSEPVTLSTTGVEGSAPVVFALNQNYPNPFNPSTMIRYSIPARSFVTLSVYDILGREVAQLVNGEVEMGKREASFDGAGLASGMYFVRLQSGERTASRKIILEK